MINSPSQKDEDFKGNEMNEWKSRLNNLKGKLVDSMEIVVNKYV
jgi:hypothetical protein